MLGQQIPDFWEHQSIAPQSVSRVVFHSQTGRRPHSPGEEDEADALGWEGH
jgi:hypothetical protein